MSALCPERINTAIYEVCHDIWPDMNKNSNSGYSEELLWEELVNCILSSQVKFELSSAFLESLKQKKLLDFNQDIDSYEEDLVCALKSPVLVGERLVKYRFPNAKAKQISNAKRNIYSEGLSLKALFDEYPNSLELRTVLVNLVPGLGMKQASMFLRNMSKSFDLAVIDSHILKYMNIVNLIKNVPVSISKLQYLQKEKILKEYTNKFDYPIGCVDYAIWVVMRVAGKEGYL